MKTVPIIFESTVRFKLPTIPTHLTDEHGKKHDIAHFTNEQLLQLAGQWAEELIQTAAAKRGAPRGK